MTTLEKVEKIKRITISCDRIKKSLKMCTYKVEAMTDFLTYKAIDINYNKPCWKHFNHWRPSWKHMSKDKLEEEIKTSKTFIWYYKNKLLEKEQELKELLNTP